jgi:cytochrome c oxidase cbb3-type subunit 3
VPLVVVGVVGIGAFVHEVRHERRRANLLMAMPNQVSSNESLLDFGVREGAPLFAAYCANCHGADLTGNSTLGAPNLADSVWLYGAGGVYDIERTVLYGIRSGHGKSRNVTDMPAFGQLGVLNDGEIRAIVQYLLKLSGRPYQVEAANDGRALFYGKPNCADCHGPDGRGDPYYGSPDLTADVWNSGGDVQNLYDAIYFGQHHNMQAWLGTLSLFQIRALATYVYSVSHPAPRTETLAAEPSP